METFFYINGTEVEKVILYVLNKRWPRLKRLARFFTDEYNDGTTMPSLDMEEISTIYLSNRHSRI